MYTFTKKKNYGMSSGNSVGVLEVTPDAATGNITLTGASALPAAEIGAVLGVVPLAEDTASGAQISVQATVDGTTKNKINFKLYKADHTAATAFKKFGVAVLIAE